MSLFLTFDGTECAGKTTIIKMIISKLSENFPALNFVYLREPGGTIVSEKIRNLLLDSNLKFEPETEALLFAASRHENTVNNIVPNLLANNIILCDRFIDSSLVYQGAMLGVSERKILDYNDSSLKMAKPDFRYYLICSFSSAQERVSDIKRNNNVYDDKGKIFHDGVIDGFTNLAIKNHNSLLVNTSNVSIDSAVKEIYNSIVGLMNEKSMK